MTIDEAKAILAVTWPEIGYRTADYWQARATLAEANLQRLVEDAGPFASLGDALLDNVKDDWPIYGRERTGKPMAIITAGHCRKLAATVKEVTGG